MNVTRALRFLLGLVLLAVWQGAMLHPLQHVDAKGAFVHVQGNHAPKIPGDKNAPNPLCDTIAAVAACVASAPQIAIAALTGVDSIHQRETVRLPGALSLAYRSQAPPSLL